MIDLTGKRFGRLTVVQRVENKILPCDQRGDNSGQRYQSGVFAFGA